MAQAYFTLFPEADASLNRSKTVEMSWQEIAENLTDFVYVQTKLETPLLVPARFFPESEQKLKKNVKDVWLASLDVDGVSQEEFDALVKVIKERNLKAAVYSTYSHFDSIRGIGKKGESIEPEVRARVVLPLSRPVTPLEWPYVWKAYNTYFYDLADQSCKDPSRGYFIPSIPEKLRGTETENLKFSEIIDGEEVLDVDWLISSYQAEIQEDKGNAGLPDQNQAHSVDKSLVAQFARRLKGRNRPDLQVIGAKMIQGIRGEIFEAVGGQDNMLYKFAKELAHQFPEGKAEDLAAPFQVALSAMAEASGEGFDENWLTSKIISAQALELAEIQKKKLRAEQEKFERERAEQRRASRTEEYTKESIQEFLKESGVEMDIDDFRFIISYKNGYYLFNGNGYSGPYTHLDLILACKKHLEVQARGMGFSLDDVIDRDDGPPVRKPRTRDRLLTLYGSVASAVEYNLEGKSYYDPRRDTLHLSDATECPYVAEYIPEVDEWLRAICYREDLYERLLDYLSQIPDTTRPIAAMCITGPEGVGKSALVEGIAKLWDRHPVEMSEALGAFNEGLLKSPVLLSDEDLPRDYRGKVQTELLRKLISGNTHSINRKGIARVDLTGHMRCFVTLNSISNFNFGKSRHSKQDVEAIQKRFFVLDILSDAELCRKLFNYDLFVTQGGIAKHLRHLAETRPRTDQRFGVLTDSAKYVALGDDNATNVLDLIAANIMGVRSQDAESRYVQPLNIKGVIVAPGRRVLVNPTALFEDWDVFGEDLGIGRRPVQSKLVTTLSSVSLGEPESLCIRSRRNKKLFYEINPEILEENFIRRNGGERYVFQDKLSIYYDTGILDKGYQPSEEDKRLREEAIESLNSAAVSNEDDGEEEDEEENLDVM